MAQVLPSSPTLNSSLSHVRRQMLHRQSCAPVLMTRDHPSLLQSVKPTPAIPTPPHSPAIMPNTSVTPFIAHMHVTMTRHTIISFASPAQNQLSLSQRDVYSELAGRPFFRFVHDPDLVSLLRETKHLLDLKGAGSDLKLFQIDLLDYDSIFRAVDSTAGVFHLASPNVIGKVEDPERQLIEPAVKGTENVLKAAKEVGVNRVVVTSSISSITPSPNWPSDVVKREDCWTDIDYCKQNQIWYPLSKTYAEMAAWDCAKKYDLDVVVVNPGTALGPLLPPILNASMAAFFQLLQGSKEDYKDFFMGCAHVKDVAMAHILVYENNSAKGRHLCVESISHFSDLAEKVAQLYPDYDVPSFPKDTQPGLLRAKDGAKKLMDLGLDFIPMEQIIKDSVETLKSRGFIS